MSKLSTKLSAAARGVHRRDDRGSRPDIGRTSGDLVKHLSHNLYRFYDHNQDLLYVGITVNPERRFQEHRCTKAWWESVADIKIENYPNGLELRRAERAAIIAE